MKNDLKTDRISETQLYECLKTLHKNDYDLENARLEIIRQREAMDQRLLEWTDPEINILEEAIRNQDPRSLYQIAAEVSILLSMIPT